jgi:PHD/YefM family antitoxin component YafN of YafNO toxin-antitoxin module
MAISPDTLNSLVPITQFNKGQASKIFGRLKKEKQLVVLKNNEPSAVILSPEEYSRISEIVEDYNLLMLAEKRLEGGNLKNALSETETMARLGLTVEDIDNAEDLEIE